VTIEKEREFWRQAMGEQFHFKPRRAARLFREEEVIDLGVIDEREAKPLDLLAVPRNMNEIVEARILYGKKREPKEFYAFGERSHMGKHLERLIRRGVVICEEGTYRRA
jgi:hypothetical protein